MRIAILVTFVAGLLTGGTAVAFIRTPSAQPVIPPAGILDGWRVVRDDETVVCESPAIFAVARQIECP